jgi:hypothetical protein
MIKLKVEKLQFKNLRKSFNSKIEKIIHITHIFKSNLN